MSWFKNREKQNVLVFSVCTGSFAGSQSCQSVLSHGTPIVLMVPSHVSTPKYFLHLWNYARCFRCSTIIIWDDAPMTTLSLSLYAYIYTRIVYSITIICIYIIIWFIYVFGDYIYIYTSLRVYIYIGCKFGENGWLKRNHRAGHGIILWDKRQHFHDARRRASSLSRCARWTFTTSRRWNTAPKERSKWF
jgi:hypothetical protein